MKTRLFFLLSFIFFAASCTKETVVENEFDKLKKAKVPFPFDVYFSATPDLTVPLVQCLPVEGKIFLPGKQLIKGNVDYLNEIDGSNSYVLNTGCEMIDATHLKEIFKGVLTAEDGDMFNFTGWLAVDIANVFTTKVTPFTGEIVINGGTGKFEGVSGRIIISGNGDLKNGIAEWNGDGYLAYK